MKRRTPCTRHPGWTATASRLKIPGSRLISSYARPRMTIMLIIQVPELKKTYLVLRDRAARDEKRLSG